MWQNKSSPHRQLDSTSKKEQRTDRRIEGPSKRRTDGPTDRLPLDTLFRTEDTTNQEYDGQLKSKNCNFFWQVEKEKKQENNRICLEKKENAQIMHMK